MVWIVKWRVEIDGADRSGGMEAYLTDISTEDKAGASSDTCSLTFSDIDGRLELPEPGKSIRVLLQNKQVFEGTIDTVRHTGSRSGGRILRVSAKGFDSAGKAKEPQFFHKDDGSLDEFLSDAADRAGFSIKIDPAFASINRSYWISQKESLLQLGEKYARELGGTFKLRGKKAVLLKRGAANLLPVVKGKVGKTDSGNVISWDITPIIRRRVFAGSKAEYFDRKAGENKSVSSSSTPDVGSSDATNNLRSRAQSKEQAQGLVEARNEEAKREAGEGTVTLDLAIDAQAEAMFELSGARAGIDGSYAIESVKHQASRSGGSTTTLGLKHPQSGAGKDTRKTKTKPKAKSEPVAIDPQL